MLNVPNSIVFFWFKVYRLLGCLVDHRRSKLNLMARLTSSIFFALIRPSFFSSLSLDTVSIWPVFTIEGRSNPPSGGSILTFIG